MLLNKSITLADIEAVDPDLHQSLTWMLNNCIEIKEDGQGMSLILFLRFSDFEYIRVYQLFIWCHYLINIFRRNH